MTKITFIIGTRPEALKMAPVIRALRNSDAFKVTLCTTGQHDTLLDQAVKEFDLRVDQKINLPNRDGNLTKLITTLAEVIDQTLLKSAPDYLFVHGDTATSYVAALCGYHNKISVCHVEAGLRTHNLMAPFPEEAYRQMTARLASYHYAPTEMAKKNLIDEGIKEESVIVTGNTIVDALNQIRESKKTEESNFILNLAKLKSKDKRVILATVHRRENHTVKLSGILDGLKKLAEDSENAIIFVAHPNPELKNKVKAELKDSAITIVDPLPYSEFIHAMSSADLILTDSGGIQEEAPSLNTPVLVLRDTTERPEGINDGFIKVIGTATESIIEATNTALSGTPEKKSRNPYGDGKAAERILNHLLTL